MGLKTNWATMKIAFFSQPLQAQNLRQAAAGKSVKISGFGSLSASTLQHLQAYGLLPGRSVRVLAQSPVTIVLVEQTELAFEGEIAQQVWIETSDLTQ